MEKITKKQFVEILTSHTSVFCGSVFRWNDEKCERGMESIGRIDENDERRMVTEKHANYIETSVWSLEEALIAAYELGKQEWKTKE